jgi:hypothetical protein
MSKQRIIVVLGMHRSGTSAIARGLKALSVELGDNLMPAVPNNNDRGFWEDMDVYKFNERLFARLGTAWDRLSAIDTTALSASSFAQERYEAAALVERKLAISPVFGFKDPRFSLLLPFWRCVFEDLGVDAGYVVAVRNPLEVAASLVKRDKFETTYGVLLWLKYTWAALQNTSDQKRVGVSYRLLVEDATAQLARIGTTLDLPFPGTSNPAVVEYISEFLADDLRHNRISDREISRHENLPAVVKHLYSTINEWCTATTELQIPTKLKTEAQNFLADNRALIELGDQLKTRVSAAEKARTELGKTIDQLNLELKSRESKVTALGTQVADLTEQLRLQESDLQATKGSLENQGAELQKLKVAEANLRNNVFDLGEQLKSRTSAMDAQKQQILALTTEVQLSRANAQASSQQRDAAVARLTDLELETSKKTAELQAAEADLQREKHERESHRQELLRALNAKDAEVSRKSVEIQAAQADLDRQKHEAEASRQELLRILNARDVEIRALRHDQARIEAGHAQLQRELSQLKGQSDSRLGQAEELLRSRTHALDRLSAELSKERSRSASLQAQLQVASESAAENLKHLRLSRQALNEIRSSTSWILTRPLRACRQALTAMLRNFKQN